MKSVHASFHHRHCLSTARFQTQLEFDVCPLLQEYFCPHSSNVERLYSANPDKGATVWRDGHESKKPLSLSRRQHHFRHVHDHISLAVVLQGVINRGSLPSSRHQSPIDRSTKGSPTQNDHTQQHDEVPPDRRPPPRRPSGHSPRRLRR